MEYCEGKTLKNYLENNRRILDRKKIIKYFSQLVESVRHIHEYKIIHRDLK